MIHDKIPVDISRLKEYFPEFDTIYQQNNPVNNESIIFNADATLDINEDEQVAFENRYILLMKKYSLPEDCYSDIFYINQKIIHDLNLLKALSASDTQIQNALDFLIGYQELVEEVNIKGYREDPIIIQVKDKGSNGAVPLLYDGSGRFIVKMIYKAFKTSFHDVNLSYLLEDYPEIPPLDILQKLKSHKWGKNEKLTKEMLSKTADILTDYFERHLPEGALSRKKNLFIYELFYLFNTLQYAGKVIDIDSKTLKREHLNSPYKLPLDRKQHSLFIKELIKNSKKRNNPLSGAFLTFKKK